MSISLGHNFSGKEIFANQEYFVAELEYLYLGDSVNRMQPSPCHLIQAVVQGLVARREVSKMTPNFIIIEDFFNGEVADEGGQ